ncbi:metal-dependent hydrolase [Paenibacillus filicis]|uniref:Metal-dependent hydrolase n=1 Tax=Paenibacillus gyeongsangnamensis TaxID=3388067 RepID=A0ABT4Q8D0_9BACL|nr:metal-dependent hydrolase [Paenibacillus filicis]MCZ8513125.1 metal-dependent hydrolase [Paenibacillus filicis]
MDTGSHLLFGATLAGLAMLSPTVANDPQLAHAVLAATMIGSHAPDFDTIARVKGYAAYIRVHRGLTHSVPALFLWPLALSFTLSYAFAVSDHWVLLYGWSLAAVVFHVFLDACNAYGVQCLRPFNKRWHHWDILSLFDPFLFAIHAAGLVVWLNSGWNPGWMFAGVYGITFVYIAIRALYQRRVVSRVRRELSMEGICHVVPSLHWFRWQFVMETDGYFYTGTVRGKLVQVQDVYAKDEGNSIIQATLATDGVRAFLQFAQRIHVICKEQGDGFEVQWRDVRFWYNHQLPFGVDVKLDRELNVVSASLGWRKRAWDPPFV